MRRWDAQSAELLVYTFREGLLSRLGHDLKLRAGRFDLTVGDDDAIELVVPAGALRVVTAMLSGKPAPELLTAKDKRDIEDVAAHKVLEATRFPEIRFVSRQVTAHDDGYDIVGDLTVRDQTRELRLEALRHAGNLSAQVTLQQTDFGITPYRALMGGLRIKSELRVTLTVPDDAASEGSVDATSEDVE